MPSNLVRVFTCASILSLGGFVTTAAITACSSSDTATPPGDDDDDTSKKDSGKSTGDDDDTTAKNDAGKDSGPLITRPASCKPEGTYTFGKSVYAVSTEGAVCDNYANAGNKNGGALGDVTFTKNTGDENYTMTTSDPGFKLVLAIANDKCQLAGAEQATQQNTVDSNNKPIKVALGPNHVIDFDESGGVKDTVSIFVDEDPRGAGDNGVPCVLQVTATGTKK